MIIGLWVLCIMQLVCLGWLMSRLYFLHRQVTIMAFRIEEIKERINQRGLI